MLLPVATFWMQLGPYALVAVSIGILAELIARLLRAWEYRNAWLPLLNITLMYGIVMACLAALVPRVGVLVAAALGAGAGLGYELLNLRWLHWWTFPEGRMVFVRGHVAILAVLTVLWGLVPPATWALRVAWPRGRSTQSLQERYDDLVNREQHLLGKLRAVQERQDLIEARLQAIRAKKRLIEGKVTVRKPGGDTD